MRRSFRGSSSIIRSAFAILLTLVCHAPASGQEKGAAAVEKIIAAARGQIGVTVVYDGSYRRIAYPGGDVSLERGVCTDVLIRAFRKVGVDLQALVHQDMEKHFGAYPKTWGLARPDSNIDHRRVQNLAIFFARQGKSLPPSRAASDYLPGDIVTWRLPSGVPHIGLVSSRTGGTGRLLVIHNIGQGAQEEDTLFEYTVTGHYRYF